MSLTLQQIAKLAGVSLSTASRVINEQPNVRPEVRERVWQVIREHGYQPNLAARSLARWPASMPRLPEQTTRCCCSQPINRRGNRNTSPPLSVVWPMACSWCCLTTFEAYSELLNQRRFPHVLIDSEGSSMGPAIGCNNRQGAYDGASYLLSLGHRRIGFITGILTMGSSRSRLLGYRQALSDHGLAEDPALVVEGDYQQPAGYAGAQALLALPEPPTAVFASNDVMAFGAMEAIREAGLRIPHDISVLGFDDIPQAAGVTPALTTVRQPLHEMGRQAVQMLLSYIKDPDRPFEYRELSTSLTIRSSCVPAHGAS